MTERPLFIDPIAVSGSDDDVDHEPAPRWFLGVALALLVLAAYYLGSFLDGPRESSRHQFHDGAAYEQVGTP